MIWPVPLISFSDFKYWFLGGGTKLQPPLGYSSLHWYQSGAAALAAICEQIGLNSSRPINLLLPSYFCGQTLRYVRGLSVTLHFYELTDELLPNYESILQQYEPGSIDLIIHVHYFGCVSGQEQSRNLANRLGARLIEDCAHVISPEANHSWLGDYLVFSPHKNFPLPKIGLVICGGKFDLSTGASSVRPLLSWIVRQIAPRVFNKPSKTRWGRVWSAGTTKFDVGLPSDLSVRAANLYLKCYEAAARKRAENVSLLKEMLSTVPGWKIFGSCVNDGATYLFGMVCDTPELAKKRYEILNNRVRLVMQWPDLPVELLKLDCSTKQVCDWVDRALFFTVHQQLDTLRWAKEIENAIEQESF